MQFIGYLFFRFIVFLFWLMPFRVMYMLSDGVAWLLYSVFGYRKAVVFKQLRDSFPEKSAADIERIARLSYKNLADILLESIKGFTMKEADLRQRYVFKNPELVNNETEANGNSIHMASHYSNWEWGVLAYTLFINRHVVGFYKPLSNPYIERYGKASRGSFGMSLVQIGDTSKAFDWYADKPTSYIFVSDQSTWSDNAHWVNFLNQDTACPQGGDKYARTYNFPVYYVHMNRVKRGFYEVVLEKIADPAAHLPEAEVTRRFMATLEKIILKQPENWLWSHKRWKKKRTIE
jgi:Kdo2-lipid IVA lauroyltransferase/acyltransferase